ncbi:MAG: SRPBCC family protein [Pseudomonadota bacterium]
MMQKILIGLIATIGSFLALILLQPSEYSVSRTMMMSAAAPDIFAQIDDFHRWQAWSPWAKRDPKAKASFDGPASGKGAVFAWSGNNEVGEGRMTLTESRPSESVRIKTDFVKPFVGTSYSDFSLNPEGGGTSVSWTMSGQNDFISKAICLFVSMDKVLGGEMEKGLASIKALVEADAKKPAQN